MDDQDSLTGNFAKKFNGKLPPADINAALFHSGGQLFNFRRASYGLHIFSQNLFHARRIGRRHGLERGRFLGGGSASLRDHRRRYRMRGSAMTGVAGHLALSLEVGLVEGKHHLHHFPRRLLGFLIVLLEGSFRVAEATFHAERTGNELHGRNQLVSRKVFQDLDVFVGLIGHFCVGLGRVARSGLPAG